MVTVMLLVGSLYASNSVHGDHGAARWVVIVCIYLFAVAFSVTWAISMRIYSSEIQPAATRASATCLAQSANWVCYDSVMASYRILIKHAQVSNFIVALTTPILLAKSSFAIYYLFGGCTLLTVLVCVFWMPETKGKSLEAIDRSFTERRSSVALKGLRLRRGARVSLQSTRETDGDGLHVVPMVVPVV